MFIFLIFVINFDILLEIREEKKYVDVLRFFRQNDYTSRKYNASEIETLYCIDVWFQLILEDIAVTYLNWIWYKFK